MNGEHFFRTIYFHSFTRLRNSAPSELIPTIKQGFIRNKNYTVTKSAQI